MVMTKMLILSKTIFSDGEDMEKILRMVLVLNSDVGLKSKSAVSASGPAADAVSSATSSSSISSGSTDPSRSKMDSSPRTNATEEDVAKTTPASVKRMPSETGRNRQNTAFVVPSPKSHRKVTVFVSVLCVWPVSFCLSLGLCSYYFIHSFIQ